MSRRQKGRDAVRGIARLRRREPRGRSARRVRPFRWPERRTVIQPGRRTWRNAVHIRTRVPGYVGPRMRPRGCVHRMLICLRWQGDPEGHGRDEPEAHRKGDRRDAENFRHAGRQLRVRVSRSCVTNILWDTHEKDNRSAWRSKIAGGNCPPDGGRETYAQERFIPCDALRSN